ncbi:hypothetical protein BDZ97DRAFT_1856784 [Flammula alnicola]|nr:hypothetical protein BDZ97DRAFT_1856784 [Flammula alnicola]
MTPTSSPDGSVDYGGVKYNGNGTTQNGLCSLDSSGNCVSGWEIPSNPFTAGEVITSNAYSDTTDETFDNNTGWFIHGNRGSWNVVFCNVTTLDVVYTYTSSCYLHYSSSLTDVNSTQHIMTIGLEGVTTAISYAVDGAGVTSNVTYEDTYALELSRQMLARGAKLYETTDALGVEYEYNIIGTRLQLIPLVLFSSRNVPYVHLAALYLKDPITMVQRLYGHADPVLSWEDQSDKKFGTESEADRLLVGPALSGPYTIFAVTKG